MNRPTGRHSSMKAIKSVLLFSLYVVLAVFISCRTRTAKWEGTVEDVDGVTFVRNPGEPFYGDITFELDEWLTIGNEADENFMFVRITDVDVDEEGKIYILDAGNSRLQIFDSEGHFLKTLGRKGQGPGEFDGLPFGFSLKNDRIYIREYRKMNVFDGGGDFIRSFPLDTYVVEFAVDREECLIGYADISQRDTAVRGIIRMSPEGKTVQTMAEYTDLGIKIVVAENMTYTLSPNHSYTPRLNFAPLGENAFIYGYASEYLLKVIDRDGNPLLIFDKQEPPQAISQKEKEYFIDRASESLERSRIKLPKSKIQETLYFGKHRAYFDEVISDNLQRIFIRRIKSVLGAADEVEFDIFSKDGYYLYRMELPFCPEVIRNGFVYDVQTDEGSGLIKIVKYRVRNWDQVKEKSPFPRVFRAVLDKDVF
jgi:hypothetical protein